MQYLRINFWEFGNVHAENVVITTLMQPEIVKDQFGERLVATHSQSLLEALKIASDSPADFNKVEIANDIVLNRKDWTYASVTIRKNISISGVRAPIMPALDMSLIKSAVIVVPGAHLELDGVELFNLAPGDPQKGATADYAAHLWFFLSERDDLKIIRIKNSRLVVSCVEVQHFVYAINSRLSAPQRDAMQVEIANLGSRAQKNAAQVLRITWAMSWLRGTFVCYFDVNYSNVHSSVFLGMLFPLLELYPIPFCCIVVCIVEGKYQKGYVFPGRSQNSTYSLC